MIKHLALDFGNVLATFDHMKACRWIMAHVPVSTEHNVPTERLRDWCFGNTREERRQIGMTSGLQLYDELRQQFGLNMDYNMFAQAWGDIFTFNEDVLHLLMDVRIEVALALWTNTEELHWPYIYRNPYMMLFQGSVIARSYELECRKPDRRYYEKAMDRIGASASMTLYIDDMQAHVDAFRNTGGNAERFDLTKDKPARLREILAAHDLLD